MFKFSEYFVLKEQEEKAYKFKAMRGSLTGADSYKTISHLKRYFLPYLDKKQAAETIQRMGSNIFDPEKTLASHESVPDLETKEFTHVLAKNHEGFKPGTQVKVTGAYEKDGRIIATTEKHGEIPMSRLDVPPDIRKSRSVKKAWQLENDIASRFGVTAAGSSKLFHDFSYL